MKPSAPEPDCPLCGRPNYHPTKHHLVPKSKGGRVTETMCRDCHRSIHAFFTNRELETTFNSAEALLAHPEFKRTVAWIALQDGRVKIRMTNDRGR
jgi:5-methylcytosine-specific restriction endonuclease McrA